MKRWQIILLLLLVAVFCGCVGTLFGFAIGERIGGRSQGMPAPAGQMQAFSVGRDVLLIPQMDGGREGNLF
jgi:hypothetical protein